MATSGIKFGPSQLAGASAVVYTAPANSVIQLNRVVVTNVVTATRLVSLWIVRSGDTAADDTLLWDEVPLSAAESKVVDALGGCILSAGDAIYAAADAATSVNIVGSGYALQ